MKKALEMSPFVLSSHKNSALMGRIVTEIAALSTEQITATSVLRSTSCCQPGTPLSSSTTVTDFETVASSAEVRSAVNGLLASARALR